jgi:hypothetical protein
MRVPSYPSGGTGYAGRALARSLTRPPARKTGSYQGRERAQAHPKPRRYRLTILDRTPCGPFADTGKAGRREPGSVSATAAHAQVRARKSMSGPVSATMQRVTPPV